MSQILAPYYQHNAITIHCGDCIEVMADMQENSVDAVVTDPPYGLEFMGKEWDRLGAIALADPSTVGGFQDGSGGNPFSRSRIRYGASAQSAQCWHQQWGEQALRVLKPGGHLLCFGGTRTHHRLYCGLEDAGFEIRDTLAWIYGQGFPKSLDISKAIDKMAPRRDAFVKFAVHFRECRLAKGLSRKDIAHHFPSATGGMTGCVWNWENGANVPTLVQWQTLQPMLGLSEQFLPLIERVEAEREVVGRGKSGKTAMWSDGGMGDFAVTMPATPEAEHWQGWGTALKPSWEPILLARKPISEKNIALNVLKWGTGGLDIDGCRIAIDDCERVELDNHSGADDGLRGSIYHNGLGYRPKGVKFKSHAHGRWPANLILDPEAARLLDEQSGDRKAGGDIVQGSDYARMGFGFANGDSTERQHTKLGDSGGASRFFYCAKASPRDRGKGNNHPTCKPTKLMEWLIQLVSREGQTILDPFLGSGTTAIAASRLGRHCIGIEKSEEYCEIAAARLQELGEKDK